MAQALRMLDK